MANRIAFVFGSNGPAAMAPLEFARSDSERFANILASETCGFEVRAPIDRTDVFRVKKDFAAAIENCGPADTFVCYFAGHGVLNRGTLLLLWDDTDPKRLLSTAIAVSEITYGLAQCEANSKLLILDCCHAGGAVPTLGLRNALGAPAEELVVPPENFLVLMASGRLERARELRDLGGGFLTSALLRALNPLDGWELRDQSRQVTF